MKKMKTDGFRGVEMVSSSTTTEQFRSFARAFKSDLKAVLGNEYVIESFNRGHFYLSGFVRNVRTGRLGYFLTSDVRGREDVGLDDIAIRTAEHIKDYYGGRNHLGTLAGMKDTLDFLTA